MRMLLRADDDLVPKFFKALEENGQEHVARMLRGPGDLRHLSHLVTQTAYQDLFRTRM